MQVEVDKLRSDKKTQDLVAEALASGKKVILRFVDDKDMAEFMDELGKIGAAVGGGVGIGVGAMSGAMLTDALIGGSVAGPAGMAAGLTIGAVVGLITGALTGYTLGAWLARFIYGIAGKDGKIETKKLWDWFGFRKGRVQVKLLIPSQA